jgi:hypothetical protein
MRNTIGNDDDDEEHSGVDQDEEEEEEFEEVQVVEEADPEQFNSNMNHRLAQH